MTLKKIISNKKYLFLDRDGVINRRKIDNYITQWEEFEFLPGVLDALDIFAKYFKRIIIVTNQQGIGKGIMKEEELQNIHQHLIQKIHHRGGRIDAIFYCPMLREALHNCRKPNPFMAEAAKTQFPEINFKESIIIGDTATDMEFGKNLGIARILLKNEYTTNEDEMWAQASIKNLTEISNLLNHTP